MQIYLLIKITFRIFYFLKKFDLLGAVSTFRIFLKKYNLNKNQKKKF
jgi:hypothetical protein